MQKRADGFNHPPSYYFLRVGGFPDLLESVLAAGFGCVRAIIVNKISADSGGNNNSISPRQFSMISDIDSGSGAMISNGAVSHGHEADSTTIHAI